MEDKIYQILKKHRLPLKKREVVLTDLLALFDVSEQNEQLIDFLLIIRERARNSKEFETAGKFIDLIQKNEKTSEI